jgi:hypothetical protein
MNRFDKLLGKQRQAEIKFLDGEFQVMSPGEFVVCAVTGAQIPLDQLRYWDVETQEPYANAQAALTAEKARRGL